MNRDANGIRWVSFEPAMTEGIFLQDEGSFIPTVGCLLYTSDAADDP